MVEDLLESIGNFSVVFFVEGYIDNVQDFDKGVVSSGLVGSVVFVVFVFVKQNG